MKKRSDTVIISYLNVDEPLLIVGRQYPKRPIEIVNAFHGEEAEELYQRLVTKKEKENGTKEK